MAREVSMEISRNDLQILGSCPKACITELKQLSSYNWIDADKPVIAVPGLPPLWHPPKVSRPLQKDSGLFYINQNAARLPESPLEPLFRALYMMRPSFDIRSIDVVTDRKNIRKLLSFVTADSKNKETPDSFTIIVEMVKNTAIFCSKDKLTQEYIAPHEFKGYGHGFEKAYTKSQINCSSGHHRIISYRFCGMAFIVRHETDGYSDFVADLTPLDGASTKDDNYLSRKLKSFSISTTNDTSYPTMASSRLAVRKEGHEVPLSATLEIKTRVSHKVLHIGDVAPQLWISQTPKLVRAYHRKGKFEVPVVEDVADEIKVWEADNEEHLQSLAALVRKIISFSKQCGGKAIITYKQNSDVLVLRNAERKSLLPEDVYCHWSDCTDHREESPEHVSLERT